jgi:hypothetical protein
MGEINAERPTDVELMEAVIRRDSGAMAAIYQRYESTLRAVILSVLHEEGDTDDVLRDVFIQLWNRAESIRCRKGFARISSDFGETQSTRSSAPPSGLSSRD